MALAFGEIGLLPDDFYRMSWKEFFLTAKGFYKKYWNEWEQTRLIAYTTATTVQSKKRLPSMRKWMPLPSDKQYTVSYDQAKMNDVFEALKNK